VRITEVHVNPLGFERYLPVVGEDGVAELRQAAAHAARLLEGRTVWNVNSTATGGGVAEMLPPLLAYSRGAGVDVRWVTIEGDPAFFATTKRLHNVLHGVPVGGGTVGDADRDHYEQVLRGNAEELLGLVRDGDVVLLHDPQTAGLVPAMRAAGATTLWRCHIGTDQRNELTRAGWAFLLPYLEPADGFVFSRQAYVPAELEGRAAVIAPSIDPFSPKNEDLDAASVRAILTHVGLVRDGAGGPTTFTRRDGTPGRVDRVADVVGAGAPPHVDDRLVVQVSRWDRLKDMQGVLEAFAHHTDLPPDVHLALVGPNVSGVTDDPEGAEVLDECVAAWRDLPHALRGRVQLVCLPLTDTDENAAIVNAVQRHAAVIVQKSLAEGFGLTVTEGMWKRRPIIASAVGGIVDQIVDGEHGVLLQDPRDPVAFGEALGGLLVDPDRAERLAAAARRRVADEFLNVHHLARYHRLLTDLLES
jgi:trehalose synthase